MDSDISLGYFGSYLRFHTLSKKDASPLIGADNLVGDRYSIEFDTLEGKTVAWMKNRFGAHAGYFDSDDVRRLQICAARGWTIVALLSFVAYTNNPKPGSYWGEAAVICYDPRREGAAFERFISSIGRMMADSLRPDVSLGADGVRKVIESKGEWVPSSRVPMPDTDTSTLILKNDKKLSEKIIEMGRSKNKGCYAISWLFIALLIAALVFLGYLFLSSLGFI